MIKASCVLSVKQNVRSFGDARHRVDRYSVLYICPPDAANPEGNHSWCCGFEVPVNAAFEMRDFENKAQANSSKGYKI